MRRVRLHGLTVSALCAVTALCGCGGADKSGEDTDGSSGTTPREADAQPVSSMPWPSDPCAWVTAAEVTSTVGPLGGPPRVHEGDCLVPLQPPPPDAETLRRQEAARKLEELARKMGSTMPPDRRPTEPAVIVSVQMRRSVDELAISAAEDVMAGWAGVELNDDTRPTQKWDVARSPITIGMPGFYGRSGELSVMVQLQAISLPKEKVAALAAVVRDRVPDHPYLAPPDEQPMGTPARRAPDPCSLLTRKEAEGVLGPLLVPPYRTRQDSPFVDPGGDTCAYYSAGHRVLALTPQWSYGESTLDAARATGGLVAQAIGGGDPEAADTIEGPWDQAAAMPLSASYAFLTGDRSLEVAYGTSSTDAAGAIRLSTIAVPRLAKARTR